MLPAGETKRIYIDRIALQRNPAETPTYPVIVVATDTDRVVGFEAEWSGPSKIVYEPRYPLKDGGTACWIETDAEVTVR